MRGIFLEMGFGGCSWIDIIITVVGVWCVSLRVVNKTAYIRYS